MPLSDLAEKYSWLSIVAPPEKYLRPDYYDRVLKDYIFEGKRDIEFLRERCGSISEDVHVVEFGPGSGRATEVALNSIKNIKSLTLVDLSDWMLEKCQQRFADKKFIEYVKSDSVDFLLATREVYDFAFSLWSFSHSTHQNLQNLGIEHGSEKVRRALVKFLIENLKANGSFYLMHFDSLSDEQRISIKQRKRDNPIFVDDQKESPSKLLIDEILANLKLQGIIEFTATHYDGKPLEFSSLEEALEYYTNFHMECHFNSSAMIGEIITELSVDLEKHRDKDGIIRIIPGCFVYDIKRLSKPIASVL